MVQQKKLKLDDFRKNGEYKNSNGHFGEQSD